MKTCPNCGTAADDSAAFCEKCGTAVPNAVENAPRAEETNPPVCAGCGAALEQEAAFCSECGMPAPKAAAQIAGLPTEQAAIPAVPQAKKGPRKIILIAAAAVVVIAAVVAGIFLLKPSAKPSLVYMKEDELNITGLGKIDPLQVTDDLYNGGDGSDTYIYSYINFSEDGKYMFYPDGMSGSDSTMDLYFINLKANNAKNSTAKKIDSGVSSYKISLDGTKVFYLKNEKLYFYDMKDAVKLDSDVTDFYITDDGSKLLYIAGGALYLKDMKAGGDAEKLDSDAIFEHVSKDFSKIYYLKDGDLYLKEAGKEKVKIDSEVSEVPYIYDTGEIYYSKSATEDVPLSDYVKDDMKSDAVLTEPDYNDYIGTDEDGYTTFDYDAYYADSEAYNAKLMRDELRAELRNTTYTVTKASLYYYNGTEPVKLSDDYNTSMSGSWEKALVVYSNYKTSDIPSFNLSEITSVYDVQDALGTAYDNGSDMFVAIGAKTAAIDASSAESFQFNEAGTALYFIDNVNNDDWTGDLYTVAINGDTIGTPEIYAEDIYDYYSILYGKDEIAYFKDVDIDTYCGDLYVNKNSVDSDVYCYDLRLVGKELNLLYRSDADQDDYTGTLKKYDGKKTMEIADDVNNYQAGKDGTIAYITDYDSNDSTGDAYLYTGTKQPKLIDEDVSYLLMLS